jgi:transposase
MHDRWGVAGADAHKKSITFAVLDSTGGEAILATFNITPGGMVELLAWLESSNVRVDRIGIEGSAGWGLPVA